VATAIKSFTAPVETLKGGLNVVVDTINSLLEKKLPWPIDQPLMELLGVTRLEYFAKGGIVDAEAGGTPALIDGIPSVLGEAGAAEVVMPLTPEGVKAVVPAMLREAVELPGLDLVVAELKAIRERLDGTLQVDVGARLPTEPREAADEMSQLAAGVGIMGVM